MTGGRVEWVPGGRTLIMGIMNVTPDSFFDGGVLAGPDDAAQRAEGLVRDGADILDVGGESSRPGADPVSVDEELRRVLPALERIRSLNVPISIDTYHAETARRALAAGASMVNDITALRGDPAMAQVVAEARCACVLMHMLGTPRTMQDNPHYDDVVDDICLFFEERIRFATDHGVAESALWLDPGFGFGKTVSDNLEMLRRLHAFKQFGLPVLVGCSNKSAIGAVLGLPVDDRKEGTAATIAIAIHNGADAVRVHDVKEMARVAAMSDAIVGRGNHD